MRIRTLSALALAALATTLAGSLPLSAQTATTADAYIPVDETPANWFIQFESPSVVQGSSSWQLALERAAFRTAAWQKGISFTERRVFDTLWNGMSVRATPAQLAALRKVSGVVAVFPVIAIDAPQELDGDIGQDMATAVLQSGVNLARQIVINGKALDGAGVKVGVIDTGITYDHPDLAGPGYDTSKSGTPQRPTCPGSVGCRVVAGYDFVGDDFNSSGSGAALIPQPDGDPHDCERPAAQNGAGHGTHVSGIVGAKAASANGVTGVAPGVSFGAYRVFGCGSGSTTDSDVLLDAMVQAYQDGMDVVNQSLGASNQWPQYPTAVVADLMSDLGVVMVASAGNSGLNSGAWSHGAPGVGAKVISVASIENTAVSFEKSFQVSAVSYGYSNATGAPAAPTSGTIGLTRSGTTATVNDGCNAFAAGSLTGKAVLIRRGTCSFATKALNAQNAGAGAVVLYNNASGFINATVAGGGITIPVVTVSAAQGATLSAQIPTALTDTVNLTWTSQAAAAPNPSANLASDFSSYGLSPDLVLKPDVAAPGGNIRSTYPLMLGGYASLSGTSMSSPHTAGSVALMIEADKLRNGGNKTLTPARVRTLLQNSADPVLWRGNPGLGFYDTLARVGAGMIDVDDTINSTLRVEPSKLSLGEGEAGPQTRTLTISNTGAASVTLSLSSVNALSHGRALAPNSSTSASVPFFGSDASASFSAGSVTVPAGGSATVDVTVTPATPASATNTPLLTYSGYAVLTDDANSKVYRVPFAGVTGDYQSVKILSNPQIAGATVPGLPWMAYLANGNYNRIATSRTFTMVNGDIPYFLMHFDHYVQRYEMQIVGGLDQRPVDPVNSNTDFGDYVGRNGTQVGFFAFVFDGTRVVPDGSGGYSFPNVPNGLYRIRFRVLKANGNAGNPAHWEQWTSPVIRILRPVI